VCLGVLSVAEVADSPSRCASVCLDVGRLSFMNYMDYVDDDAMVLFTAQQVVRMRTALDEARPGLK
jgi:hypothetical protein